MVLDNVNATVVNNINVWFPLGQTVSERDGRIEIGDNDNREIIF